jgi:hypothetical protein
MAAESRSFFILVFGRDEPKGFILVTGFEGGLLAGLVVFVVENTPWPEEYTESLFHVIFHFMTMNQLDLTSLACSGRVRFGFWPPSAATETFTETRPLFRYFPLKSQQKGWRRGSESDASRLPQATRNQLSKSSPLP